MNNRFTLIPEREINFGPMPTGAPRRIEKCIIENHGEAEFKYSIVKHQRDASPQKVNAR
jgi:hypothetical protein